MIRNVKIGSDPELFIINTKTGKVVSSIGIIPGVKGEPYVAKDMPKGYGLQTDNILAEFNIPPVKTQQGFVSCMNYMKDYIKKYVKNINEDLDIMCASSAIVDEDQLQSKEAKEFGCDIDYNAYTEEPNPKPEGTSTNMRSAGCHIHVSYNNPNTQDSLNLIKYLDMYLGIPFVIIDKDNRRRKLYGKAGCFRLCKYGFEYRTLGGYALSSDKILEFVYTNVKKAITAYNNDWPLASPDTVQDIINNNKEEQARELISKFKLVDNDFENILFNCNY